jgi:hypothetical protein
MEGSFYPKSILPKMNKTLKKKFNNVEFAIGSRANKVQSRLNAVIGHFEEKINRNTRRNKHIKTGASVLGGLALIGAIGAAVYFSTIPKA